MFERSFLFKLTEKFLNLLENFVTTGENVDTIVYFERFLEFFTDIIVQLPTRRFFNVVLDDIHFVRRCFLSSFVKSISTDDENIENDRSAHLFYKMLLNFKFYSFFELNDATGESLSSNELIEKHCDKLFQLQKAIFQHFRDEMPTFPMQNIRSIDSREVLIDEFEKLSNEQLKSIGASLRPAISIENRDLFIEVLVGEHERFQSHLELINSLPLYPTEETIWDEDIVPTEFYTGEKCLALPKLNLQFLSLHDYLLRNFHLFRLESTYEIRQDLEDSISRMKPWQNDATILNEKSEENLQQCLFGGWSRMAQPITNFTIVEVGKSNLGENHPSRVRADVSLVLNTRPEIKREWEKLRRHDICFLVTVRIDQRISFLFSNLRIFNETMFRLASNR